MAQSRRLTFQQRCWTRAVTTGDDASNSPLFAVMLHLTHFAVRDRKPFFESKHKCCFIFFLTFECTAVILFYRNFFWLDILTSRNRHWNTGKPHFQKSLFPVTDMYNKHVDRPIPIFRSTLAKTFIQILHFSSNWVETQVTEKYIKYSRGKITIISFPYVVFLVTTPFKKRKITFRSDS